MGIDCQLCRSGAEALERLAGDSDFDVVIVNHQMAEIDGIELTRQLRVAGFAMPVLLLSSNPGVARDCPMSGEFAAILQMPMLRADLYRALQGLEAEAVAQPLPAEAPAVTTEPRVMRVLSAEDNRTNQLVLQKMMRGLRVELAFADNGRAAVEIGRASRPT